jgi:hypothetical protein
MSMSFSPFWIKASIVSFVGAPAALLAWTNLTITLKRSLVALLFILFAGLGNHGSNKAVAVELCSKLQ